MGFLGVLISLFVTSAHASAPLQSLTVADLKSGDVLLQSVPCYICALIEIEEAKPFSHIGVVLKTATDTSVLQAWGTVQAMPYAKSIALRKANTTTTVLRAVDVNHREVNFDSQAMQTAFEKDFLGLSYDEAFLWNNRDDKGEKLYCSEFVAKFLDLFLPAPIPPKAMHFVQYRQDWMNYFKGAPPDGQAGISPADFFDSPQFEKVGEIP